MKKSQIQQMSMEIAVGAFIVFMMVTLGFLTIILGKGVFTARYPLRVRFDDVTGLIRGDKVYLHGVDVGRVRNMTAEPGGVVLDLVLLQLLEFHEGYSVSVEASSVLGGRFVDIKPGDPARPALPPGTELAGKAPVDFIAEASATVKAIRNALEEGGVLGNLEGTLANFRKISDDAAAGRGTLGKLLQDESLYTNLSVVATNLVGVSTNLRAVTARLEAGEGTLGKLLTKDEVYEDFRQAVTDIREIADRLAQGKGTIGRLLAEDDTTYQDLTATMAQLKDATASIKTMAASLEKGEGTLGKLIREDAVYQDLRALVQEARAALDDLRETSPIVSFSSVFFGAF